MVPVSINLFLKHSMHTASLFKFQDLKTRIFGCHGAQECFCSLGYFKTWSLICSLCRQTSQQASPDGFRYSLAGEMIFKYVYLSPHFVNQISMNVYCFDIHGLKPSNKLTINLVSLPGNVLMVFNFCNVIKTNTLYTFTSNLDIFPLEIN